MDDHSADGRPSDSTAPEDAAAPEASIVTESSATEISEPTPPPSEPTIPTVMPAGGIASAAPPPVAWAPAPSPATTVESGQVTGLARVAGIILIVLGALTTLGGVILLTSGAFLGAASSQTDVPFFAGIGARRGSGAARITGIVVGVLFAYFGLVGLVGAGDGNSGDSSPLVALAILLLYGFVALVLAFRWKSRSA